MMPVDYPARRRGLVADMLRPRGRIYLALLACGIIAWFTLRPPPSGTAPLTHAPFSCLWACGTQTSRDALLNVLLFIPLGASLRPWLRVRQAWLVAVGLTCGIELAQALWLPGREPSLRDILTNALGAGIGMALATGWRRLVFPAPVAAARLGAAAFLVWGMATVGAAAGSRPRLPLSPWWGQWAHAMGGFEPWRGAVLAMAIAGQPVPDDPLPDWREARRALMSDSGLVELTIVSGPRPRGTALIASVSGSRQEEVVLLMQRGDDLLFRIRTGLAAAGFRGQTVRLRDFPGRAPGDTARIRAGVVGGHWVLEAEARNEVRRLRLPLGTGLLWNGLSPFPVPLDASTLLLNGAWLGGLILPAGYWFARASGRPWTLGLLLSLALGLLFAATMTARIPWPAGSEQFGTAIGAAAGWGLGVLARRRGGGSPACL